LLLYLIAGSLWGGTPEGQAVFEGKGGCVACHAVGDRGGSIGPDLSDIGVRRSPEYLLRAVTDPDADIEREYLTIAVLTNSGRRVEGIRLNEDDFSIQIRDASGNLRSFLKSDLKSLTRELRSLMPPPKLSAGETRLVVEYLSALRGRLGGSMPRRAIAAVSENLEWLTRPDRDADEQPTAVLDALELAPAAVVADVGAGAGYFTWRLAQRAAKVYAVDLQQEMLARTAQELKRRGVANVELVRGSDTDPHLPEDALDLVLLASAYHEFSQPEAMMAAIHRSLKPNGRLAVLEYRKEDSYSYLEELHKMTLRGLRVEIEGMGFQTLRIHTFLPRQHFVTFQKRQP
jgi:putative heme-binding domain-containing protein